MRFFDQRSRPSDGAAHLSTVDSDDGDTVSGNIYIVDDMMLFAIL